MIQPKAKEPCPRCHGARWVCEAHPDTPWTPTHERTCGGAGMPCPLCNDPDEGERPELPSPSSDMRELRHISADLNNLAIAIESHGLNEMRRLRFWTLHGLLMPVLERCCASFSLIQDELQIPVVDKGGDSFL